MYVRLMECATDLEATYQRAAATRDGPGMAQAVLERAGFRLAEWRGDVARLFLRSWLERAETAVDPTSDLALRLRLWQAALDDVAGGGGDRIDAVAQEAWQRDDPQVRTDALNLLYQCRTADDAAGRRELARQLVSLGLSADRPATLALGLLWNCVELAHAGEPALTGALHALRAAVARHDQSPLAPSADRLAALVDLRAGRVGRSAGGLHDLARQWYQGRAAEAYPSIAAQAEMAAADEDGPLWLAALAQAAAAAGATRRAEAALARLSALGRRTGDPEYRAALYWGVETAAVLRDRDFAEQAYQHLQPAADRPLTAPLEGVCFGSADQALGVAAVTLGDYPRAEHHLTAAVRANLALGHWPALVFTRTRLAQCRRLHDPRRGTAPARRELQLAARDAVGLPMEVPAPDRFPLNGGAWLMTSPSGEKLTLRRHGTGWEVSLGWRRITVGEMKGMGYLAVLVANPDREIRAIDLAAGPGTARERLSTHPVLDETALRAYRQRLDELQHHTRRIGSGTERPDQEMEWLRAQLAAMTGPGGRRRAFADPDERARIAVGKAIRRAIEQVSRTDPVIGSYLRSAIHTGAYCVFTPC